MKLANADQSVFAGHALNRASGIEIVVKRRHSRPGVLLLIVPMRESLTGDRAFPDAVFEFMEQRLLKKCCSKTLSWKKTEMKTPQIITLAVLSGALSLAPTAHAQNGTGGTGSTGTTTTTSNTATRRVTPVVDTTPEPQQGPNPGWLGLLGLAGLAGLMKKPQREVVHQTEVRTTGTTGTTPNVRQ